MFSICGNTEPSMVSMFRCVCNVYFVPVDAVILKFKVLVLCYDLRVNIYVWNVCFSIHLMGSLISLIYSFYYILTPWMYEFRRVLWFILWYYGKPLGIFSVSVIIAIPYILGVLYTFRWVLFRCWCPLRVW